jgi:hypothetical protein
LFGLQTTDPAQAESTELINVGILMYSPLTDLFPFNSSVYILKPAEVGYSAPVASHTSASVFLST